MVVIADDNGVESIAGVMGGEVSGCDDDTTDVLIESALWDPQNIAHTGRKLGIVTDARYRFERGVDPSFALPGLELATQLVLELCGGEPSELVVVGGRCRARAASSISPGPRRSASRASTFRRPTPRRSSNASASRSKGRRGPRDDHRAELAPGHRGQGRYRRGNRPHRSASTMCPRRRCRAWMAVAAAVLTLMQKRASNATPGACHAGSGRGRHLVLHLEGAGGSFRRRRAGPCARQSDRQRSFRHAPEPAAGPRRRRPSQRRAGTWRSGAVRGGPDLPRSERQGSATRRRRHSSRAFRRRASLVRRPRNAPAPSTPRPM